MTRKRSTPVASGKAHSQRELSRRMGVSRSTVDRWRRDGLKPDNQGHYDLNQAREFQRVRTLRSRDIAAADQKRRLGVLNLKEDRLRVDLQLAEYKLLITKGEYISRQIVIQKWRKKVIQVRNALKGLGRSLAVVCAHRGPLEIESAINQKIFEILRGLAHDDARANGKDDAEHSRQQTIDTLIHQPIEGGTT